MGKRTDGAGKVLIGGGIIAAVLLLLGLKKPGFAGGGSGSGGYYGSLGPRVPVKLRLTASGLLLDGNPVTEELAVAAARQSGLAELVVTGDANFGDRERLLESLRQAKVAVKL